MAEMARLPETCISVQRFAEMLSGPLTLHANERSIFRKRSTTTELRDDKREDGGEAWRELRRRTEHNCYGEDPQLLPIRAKLARRQSIPLSRGFNRR